MKIRTYNADCSASSSCGHHAKAFAQAVSALRVTAVAAVCFGLVLNLVQLGLPIYTMQLFDRVLPSGHLPTLAALTLLLAFATLCAALVDASRALLLSGCASRLGLLFDKLITTHALVNRHDGITLSDVDMTRNFMTGPSAIALLDLPWTIVYVFALFFIHPYIGLYAVSCFAILLLSTLSSRYMLSNTEGVASRASRDVSNQLALLADRTSILGNLGASPGILREILRARSGMLDAQQSLQSRLAWTEATTKALRSGMQLGILALATVLVVLQDTNAGAIVASSMLFSKAVAPLERLSATLTTLRQTRLSWVRLKAYFTNPQTASEAVALPEIKGEVIVRSATIHNPSRQRLILDDITLEIKAGKLYVVVGAEGAGKSALLQLIGGLETPTRGLVTLDGMILRNYNTSQLSSEVGYLPHQVFLRPMRVDCFISRGDDVDQQALFKATKLTGADAIIRQLPDGYQTQISSGSKHLSVGEFRRLALASAIYKSPRLLLLDEPMCGMDESGEHDTVQVIRHFKDMGHTVVVVSKAAQLLHLADELILLDKGRLKGITDGAALRARIGPRSLVS